MNRKLICLMMGMCITISLLCGCGRSNGGKKNNNAVFAQSKKYKEKYAERMTAYRQYYDELKDDEIDGIVMLNTERLPYMIFVQYGDPYDDYDYDTITIVDFKDDQAQIVGQLTGENFVEAYYCYDHCIIQAGDDYWQFDGENLLGQKIIYERYSTEEERIKELLKDYPCMLESKWIYYDVSTKPYKCLGYELYEDIRQYVDYGESDPPSAQVIAYYVDNNIADEEKLEGRISKAIADYTGIEEEYIEGIRKDTDYWGPSGSFPYTDNIQSFGDYVRYGANGMVLRQLMKDLETNPVSEIEELIINERDYFSYNGSWYYQWAEEELKENVERVDKTVQLWLEEKEKEEKYGEAKKWIDAYQKRVDTDHSSVWKLVDFDDSGIPYLVCESDIYHYENGNVKKIEYLQEAFLHAGSSYIAYCKEKKLLLVGEDKARFKWCGYYDVTNFKNIASRTYGYWSAFYDYDDEYFIGSNKVSEREYRKAICDFCGFENDSKEHTLEFDFEYSIDYNFTNYETSVELAYDDYIKGKEDGEKSEKIEVTVLSHQEETTPSSSQNNTTPQTSNTSSSAYILPNSNTKYLTKSDLQGFTAEQCKIARNEIYARYGRKFTDATLQSYFNSCSWYKGTIEPDKFDDSVLNEYEKANRDLIVEYESEMGYR